jgi:hypothetical protein
MKPIQKDELYENLGEFLKGKGIELKEGAYTKGIHAGCSLLADAINLSQTGFERAKAELDKKLSQVRQVIHEKTAPKTGSNSRSATARSASGKSTAKKSAAKSRKSAAKTSKNKPR